MKDKKKYIFCVIGLTTVVYLLLFSDRNKSANNVRIHNNNNNNNDVVVRRRLTMEGMLDPKTLVRKSTFLEQVQKAKKATTTTVLLNKLSEGGTTRNSPPPRYIFGHSAGHTGSFSAQMTLSANKDCPWENVIADFEYFGRGYSEVVGPGRCMDERSDTCDLTKNHIIPRIQSLMNNNNNNGNNNNTTYIDLGHFHNKGRVIECLAEQLGNEAAFVRIRRNRYSIANSFVNSGNGMETPCVTDHNNMSRPGCGLCPRSKENLESVNLPTESDEVWDSFTPFQRFLWYADEMEHRWYTLLRQFENEEDRRPEFYEMTWSHADQFTEGITNLQRSMGCAPAETVNHNSHNKNKESKQCAELIREDLKYRKRMGYDPETLQILVNEQIPQYVDDKECIETAEEMKNVIREYSQSLGFEYNENEWVLPPNADISP